MARNKEVCLDQSNRESPHFIQQGFDDGLRSILAAPVGPHLPPTWKDKLGFSRLSHCAHSDTHHPRGFFDLHLTHAIANVKPLQSVLPIARARQARSTETRQPPRAAFEMSSVLAGVQTRSPRGRPFAWLPSPASAQDRSCAKRSRSLAAGEGGRSAGVGCCRRLDSSEENGGRG